MDPMDQQEDPLYPPRPLWDTPKLSGWLQDTPDPHEHPLDTQDTSGTSSDPSRRQQDPLNPPKDPPDPPPLPFSLLLQARSWPPLSQLRVTRRLSAFTIVPFLPPFIFRAFSERVPCPEQLRLPGGGSEPPATPGASRTAARRRPGGAGRAALPLSPWERRRGRRRRRGGRRDGGSQAAPAGEKVPRVPPERPRPRRPRRRLPVALGSRRTASPGKRERAARVPAGAARPSRPGAGAPEPRFRH